VSITGSDHSTFGFGYSATERDEHLPYALHVHLPVRERAKRVSDLCHRDVAVAIGVKPFGRPDWGASHRCSDTILTAPGNTVPQYPTRDAYWSERRVSR
jgi:hypothetical protein